MAADPGVASLAIDLTRLHRRTVTSFYSNLVTRPTGRAVRAGLESQLAEVAPGERVCLSVLDFSQVRLLDYSCADEIVAKLLLRYVAPDRPSEVYFVARGLQDHHVDSVEAVLERHGLLLVSVEAQEDARLLGSANPLERACWAALRRRGSATPAAVAEEAGLSHESTAPTLARLASQRAVVRVAPELYFDLSYLARER
jgi:hypothetical protein